MLVTSAAIWRSGFHVALMWRENCGGTAGALLSSPATAIVRHRRRLSDGRIEGTREKLTIAVDPPVRQAAAAARRGAGYQRRRRRAARAVVVGAQHRHRGWPAHGRDAGADRWPAGRSRNGVGMSGTRESHWPAHVTATREPYTDGPDASGPSSVPRGSRLERVGSSACTLVREFDDGLDRPEADPQYGRDDLRRLRGSGRPPPTAF